MEEAKIYRRLGQLPTDIFPREKRAGEIRLIEQAASEGKDVVLILGERGAGKSSLAAYLAENPPDGCNGGIYLDLQRCTVYDDFILYFADEIANKNSDFDLDIDRPENIINYLRQRGRFLIAIDEIENFINWEDSDKDKEGFCNFLRNLRESCPDLLFLFCGYSGMTEATKDRISELISAVSSPEHDITINLNPIPLAERPIC